MIRAKPNSAVTSTGGSSNPCLRSFKVLTKDAARADHVFLSAAAKRRSLCGVAGQSFYFRTIAPFASRRVNCQLMQLTAQVALQRWRLPILSLPGREGVRGKPPNCESNRTSN